MAGDGGYQEKEVNYLKDGHLKKIMDKIVIEHPLTIFLNQREIITLMCTPEKLEYLATGFLYSEGFLQTKRHLRQVDLEKEKSVVQVETTQEPPLAEKLYGKRTLTTGCGKGSIFYSAWDSFKSKTVESRVRMPVSSLQRHLRSLQQRSLLFKQTGGVHSAALCCSDRVIFFCEDVGRHNAVDKIVGECLEKEINLEDKALVCSGRLSSEMLLKTAKLGIPVLVSRAAPTTLSVDMAISAGITLVGFARGKRSTVYSHQERIIHDD